MKADDDKPAPQQLTRSGHQRASRITTAAAQCPANYSLIHSHFVPTKDVARSQATPRSWPTVAPARQFLRDGE